MESKFTADNFQQEVLNSSQPVMVDFFANWCGPCQMMGPVIANLAEEYAGKIKIGKINVDDNGCVQNVSFMGGCHGNLQGICSLIRGMKAEDVKARLQGIRCGAKPTSCPDQLATALEEMGF